MMKKPGSTSSLITIKGSSKLFIFTLLFLNIYTTLLSQQTETIYSGTVVKSGYENNATYGPYNIGFNFTYFGNTYSQFYLSTNGLITFGSGSTDPGEDPIPSAATPNNMIAAFWDDLVIDPSGNILYTTVGAAPNRKLIVQFRNMGFYYGPVYMGTFCVILYESSNKIQVQYRVVILPFSTTAHGASATIGIENSTGTAGVQYAYHNSAAIGTGKAVSFLPSGSTYIMNSDEIYDAVYLTTNLTLPEPGIPQLLSPSEDAVIGAEHTFEWSESSDVATYTLKISTNSNLSGATNYDAGSALSYTVSGLQMNTTYYWGVFASNATGTTWCEIRRFTTSDTPPLAAVPQTVWVEQNQETVIKLNYTGGDASTKTAIITSLPAEGQLYQYNNGVRGAIISSVPANVTDANRNVIYLGNGLYGNGAGNFSFRIHDNTGDSPTALVTVNVSPPGIPNLLYVARSSGVEMQFDKTMANPAGRENQFAVTVNGSQAVITSLSIKDGDPYTISAVLATPLSGTETVSIAYTAGDVTSEQGGWLLSFEAQPVTLLAQTITFNPLSPKQEGDPPFTLSATAGSGLSLTYSSSNLSVATVSGNTCTLVSAGTSDITARQEGNATFAPAIFIRTLTVTESTEKTLYLTNVLLQGIYNGSGTMRQVYDELGPHWPSGVADHITVELHNATSYYTVEYSVSSVPLSTTGTATVTIPATYTGSYYITVKHRNSLETTTAVPVSFAGSIISQSFGSPSSVYGNNLAVSYDGRYLIYAGDVNQDGFIDTQDYVGIDNDSYNYLAGYLVTDVDGNGMIDTNDYIFVDNNNYNYIGAAIPF